jgi:hypothetical protein
LGTYRLLAPNKKILSIVRHLNNTCLNPKTDLINTNANESDLEVFSPKCSYKLTNPLLHANTKQELKKLHWQIYGVAILTKNDFMLWLVREYITQEKGYEIN